MLKLFLPDWGKELLMRCPECGWSVVSMILETRRWNCKRCKYEWTERKKPSDKAIFGSASFGKLSPAPKRKKIKASPSKAKPKTKKAKARVTRGKKRISRR
jgi:ribosomal protein S27AE